MAKATVFTMKKVGKEVLFLKTGEKNPRNGESTLLRLKDGRIMHAYTEYYGDDWEDHATARISACYSSDEGESWSAPRVIIQKPAAAQNIMSPSLFRLPDGGLGILYLRKDVQEDMGVSCMPVFSRSDDEGESWSESVTCPLPTGYYCGINDGAMVTKDGKIWMPLSYHGARYDALGKMKEKPAPRAGEVCLMFSSNSGKDWTLHPTVFQTPYIDTCGLAEPGIFEHENGDLWLWMRTPYGHQYQSLSHDGGKSWTPVEPNFRFPTPDSPMRVKRVGKNVAAVYNPIAYHCLRTDSEVWGSPRRTPIVVSLSRDDGKDLNARGAHIANNAMAKLVKNTYLLEDDTTNSYCYPAILGVKDGFLVSYYHSNGSPVCLNATKMVKVYDDEVKGEG